MTFSKRSYEKEILDQGPSKYTQEEYEDCLHHLGRIGNYLGGDQATLHTFRKLPLPDSILDVGCGGGQLTIKLGKHYPNAKVIGLDICKEAITFAWKGLLESSLENVTYIHSASPELSFAPGSFDAVTASLVCHHLNDEQLIGFLKTAYGIARKTVVINDLHRHRIAYYAFSLVSKLFFPNRLICNDGLLSIKRSFTKSEWVGYLQAAGIPLQLCTIKWHWPFRWVVTIDASSKGTTSHRENQQ